MYNNFSRHAGRSGAGFTLIELLVVIAIIGILSSIVLVSLTSAREKARDVTRLADIRSMQKALELYNNDNGRYPISRCATPDTSWTSFDSSSYAGKKICSSVNGPGVNTLAQELAPYVTNLKDPSSPLAGGGGYLYTGPDGARYCALWFRGPENMNNFPSNMWPPSGGTRCGTVNASGQCSIGYNSIFIGTGSYEVNGC